MDIVRVLEEIVAYYDMNRQVGHTEVMMRGAKDYDRPFFLMAQSTNYAAILAQKCKKATPISTWSLERLRGCDMPLVMDHYAFQMLARESVQEIRSQRAESIELKNDRWKLWQENEQLARKLILLSIEHDDLVHKSRPWYRKLWDFVLSARKE